MYAIHVAVWRRGFATVYPAAPSHPLPHLPPSLPSTSLPRRGGKTTAMNSQGRRKYHTTFDDGSELVEEYDLRTDELLCELREGAAAD
jgi:hypothetical protein